MPRPQGLSEKISDEGRGKARPIRELLYNHYVVRRGLETPHVGAFAEKLRPDGGCGDYGPTGGGCDQLGYGGRSTSH